MTTTAYAYEVAIPNPADVPAAIAGLVGIGCAAEKVESPVPGGGWLLVSVQDQEVTAFSDWLYAHRELFGDALYAPASPAPQQAVILFCEEDQDGVGAGINALREQGCDVELLPHRDVYSDAIWLKITAAPRLGDFSGWVRGIVEPHGGDVIESDFPRSPRNQTS
jgi:hypothetical protein